MAARRIVCFISGMDAQRTFRGRVIVLALALSICGGSSLSASSFSPLSSDQLPSHNKTYYLLHASLNEETLEEKIEAFPGAQDQAKNDQGQTQEFVERIDWEGNRRIRRDTLQARIFTRAGDPYNEDTLRRDFQALWNTQFFEDVKLRVEDSPDKPGGKIITFIVVERPVIRRIRYDGIKSVSESDILDRFKDKKVGLTVESQFDPTRIKKAEVVLKDLLAEHGKQYATVTPQYERIASSNAVILVFKVNEGPKVKVGKILFTGNKAFSRRKLIRAMHNDRPYSIPLYITEINVLSKTYDHDKLIEDIQVGVQGLYQDSGYYKVLVKDPIIENVDTEGWKLGIPLTGRTQGKAVNITIPIDEGERYRMGTIKIASTDPDKALSLKVDALKNVFPLNRETFSLPPKYVKL